MKFQIHIVPWNQIYTYQYLCKYVRVCLVVRACACVALDTQAFIINYEAKWSVITSNVSGGRNLRKFLRFTCDKRQWDRDSNNNNSDVFLSGLVQKVTRYPLYLYQYQY